MKPFLTWGEFDEWCRYNSESMAFPMSVRVGNPGNPCVNRFLVREFRSFLPYELENCVNRSESRRAADRRVMLWAKDERPSIRQEKAA